jgi:anthranilate 1,2-dioxygenase (deaminating, decarboxylating) large subunit
MPNPAVRPGYDVVMPYLLEKFGEKRAEWAMHRLRNLNLYPSLFLWIRSVHNYVLFAQSHGIKLKSSVNVLVLKVNLAKHVVTVFASLKISLMSQALVHQMIWSNSVNNKRFSGTIERWSDISRGYHQWEYGPTQNSQDLGIEPVITGREFTHEGLYVNQHGHWQRLLLDGSTKSTENA